MESIQTSPSGVNGSSIQEQIVLDVSNFPTMEDLEKQYLNLVLDRQNGNKARTAKILGFSIKTIYNKLDGYKVTLNSGGQ
jgi:DNA-binding NtrC family response regulator